jgi:WD40 repeat protein
LSIPRIFFTISYSPDGLRLAGGGDPGKITIWDSRSGREILYCRGHSESTQAVVFSPVDEFLASGGGDECVRLWNALTGNEIWSKKLHEGFVRGLSFDPTGQWLSSVGDDGRLIIWEARTGEGALNLIEPSGLFCVSFSPNGELLGMGSRDGTLVLWNPRIRSEIDRWQVHEEVHFVAFSADSSLLISGGLNILIVAADLK